MPKKFRFTRVESLETFPRAQRLQMKMKLGGRELEINYQGREAKEYEIGTALWGYHHALNEAEEQIGQLQTIIRGLIAESTVEEEEDSQYALGDYEERFKEDGKEDDRYNIDEKRAGLFLAIHKGDNKSISRIINEIHLLEEQR